MVGGGSGCHWNVQLLKKEGMVPRVGHCWFVFGNIHLRILSTNPVQVDTWRHQTPVVNVKITNTVSDGDGDGDGVILLDVIIQTSASPDIPHPWSDNTPVRTISVSGSPGWHCQIATKRLPNNTAVTSIVRSYFLWSLCSLLLSCLSRILFLHF